MIRPVIGITMDAAPSDDKPFGAVKLKRQYVDRVVEAGGIPILLPAGSNGADLVGLIDGWLIPGGDDIDPSLWGEPLHPEARLADPDRTRLEMEMFAAAPADLPILGICYGCQLINVAFKGDLDQHLPDALGHDGHRGDSWQSYQVDPDSLLGKTIQGSSAEGKSYHHQAVRSVGEGLRVTARHEDGTVEALESTERPWVVGVQWHPERSEAEATPLIFAEFIRQAALYRERKSS